MGGQIAGSDNSSKAIQANTTLSDQAQLIRNNSRVAQGGATQINQDKANFAQQNIRLRDGSTFTVNTGLDSEHVSSLLLGVTKTNAENFSALQETTAAQVEALGGLLTQKAETEGGNPKTLAWVAVAAVAAVVLSVIFRK